jgi:hypothetical protein
MGFLEKIDSHPDRAWWISTRRVLLLNRQKADADACVLQHHHSAFLQRFPYARDVGYEQLYLCGRAALPRAPEKQHRGLLLSPQRE